MVKANPDGKFFPCFSPHDNETQIKGMKSNISSETMDLGKGSCLEDEKASGL